MKSPFRKNFNLSSLQKNITSPGVTLYLMIIMELSWGLDYTLLKINLHNRTGKLRSCLNPLCSSHLPQDASAEN